MTVMARLSSLHTALYDRSRRSEFANALSKVVVDGANLLNEIANHREIERVDPMYFIKHASPKMQHWNASAQKVIQRYQPSALGQLANSGNVFTKDEYASVVQLEKQINTLSEVARLNESL